MGDQKMTPKRQKFDHQARSFRGSCRTTPGPPRQSRLRMPCCPRSLTGPRRKKTGAGEQNLEISFFWGPVCAHLVHINVQLRDGTLSLVFLSGPLRFPPGTPQGRLPKWQKWPKMTKNDLF